MRATGGLSELVSGNVTRYGIDNAEIRNAEDSGERFGGLCQRKLRYQYSVLSS